ncbi:cell division cycle 7-related protein kinase-like [Maniola hyperantus]|uniref:cell division cycle 7-related protein kinase-like n=1 Tax=Aphantopus hyperantus TaxID=2795564 RepID=UPI001568A1FB|nr:cell division cycle 7-related protein kinase-like [Maniola hyperantus]
MSRIRGIEKLLKVQKDGLQALQDLEQQKNKYVETKKRKNEESFDLKVDMENQQINELLLKLPKLEKIFDVHKKIGEGTFSSVYLGSLKQHGALPDAEKRWFAIKHLVPTAHPARVEHELRCLRDMGGKDNVIGVELCLRNLDTIVFVMPYIPHKKFSEYVGNMDAEEVRQYMSALLVALRHVHSFGVIHRDIKPSNFLYDRENRRYLLVDFGLAQRAAAEPPPAALEAPRKRAREQDECVVDAKRMALDLSVGARRADVAAPAGARCPDVAAPAAPRRAVLPKVHIPKQNIPKNTPGEFVPRAGLCLCANVGGVCTACAARPGARAPRAGTQGFRPPEVLLKSPRQGTSVDVWAAGVVLASLLTARYPFFRAADDVSALAELTDLLGTEPLRRTAHALGRRIVTSSRRRGLCLRRLAAHLRSAARASPDPSAPSCGDCRLPLPHCLCRDETRPADAINNTVTIAGFPDSAFALAARLLEPLPSERYSAHQALEHPFLTTRLTPHSTRNTDKST